MMYSCTKDANINKVVNQDSTQIRNSNLDHPTLWNDVYVFDDSAHFVSYYTSLSSLYDSDFEVFDSIMMKFPKIVTVYSKLSNDSFVDPADRYQPFLTDPIMQSFINEHFEFAIGDALVTYVNNEQVLTSDLNDSSVRNSIRNLSKGSIITKNSVPGGAYWGEDTEIQSFLRWPCSCQITIKQISCNELRISGNFKDFTWGDGTGDVSIYFSLSEQGQPGPFRRPASQTAINGNFEFVIDMSTFGNSGPWYVWASVDPNCFTGNTQWASFTYEEGNGSCDIAERSTGWLWANDGFNQAMSYQVSFYRNFWGSYSKSEMISKWWTGSKWKEGNAQLNLNIYENRLNSDCNSCGVDTDSNSCSFCTKISERVWSDPYECRAFAHCDDVRRTFRKTINWNNQTWFIERTASIDFECCE